MNSRYIYRNSLIGAGPTRFCSRVLLASLTFFCCAAAAVFSPVVQAGGSEFAGGGTRGLGRGGASFLRADDPQVMVQNPALLADLPDDMAMISAIMPWPDACYVPSGAFTWASSPSTDIIVLDQEEGPLYLGAEAGDTITYDGITKPLTPYKDDPFPKTCYSGGIRVFPTVALSAKVGDKLGLGLGFMPPDDLHTDFWGNGDGTVNTPNGKRPDIAAYTMAPNNYTYFGLLGAIGYRIAPWFRLGAGFRWTMIILNSANFGNVNKNKLSPVDLVRTNVYGKDLFIPGFNASIHAVPFDALDLAVGFRWEDRMRFNDFKIDVTTRPFTTGEDYTITHSDGTTTEINNPIPYTVNNLPGKLNAPPLVVPQITLGIRFADRIRPRTYETRKKVTQEIRDSMSDERWDIEANAIYYFNSAADKQVFSNDGKISILFADRTPTGVNTNTFPIGPCVKYAADGQTCTRRENVTVLGGKNQLGLRLGGDVNIIPGVFSVRAGASWDSRGINPNYAATQNMNFQRLGIHAGVTVRIAKNTDISAGYAHFFFETIEVQLNRGEEGENASVPYDKYAKDPETAAKYNIKVEFDQNGQPIKDANGRPVLSKLDGVAKATYNSNEIRSWPYINAGTYTYHMDVFGISIAQHF